MSRGIVTSFLVDDDTGLMMRDSEEHWRRQTSVRRMIRPLRASIKLSCTAASTCMEPSTLSLAPSPRNTCNQPIEQRRLGAETLT